MNNKKKRPFSVYRYILGYSFLFFGIVAGLIPILQGWIFIVLGLVLLKDERWARKARVWLQRRYPATGPIFQKVYIKLDAWLGKWWGV